MPEARITSRRRFTAPEVIQISATDCGPASLKCIVEGYGIPVSYGRLREACQTDVDGTSIDTVEELARQLGLAAEQVMLPPDFLLLSQGRSLPAIVVVRQPSGAPHFIVVWRRHGRFFQVMDPSGGRRWISREKLLDELYVHVHQVSAAAWRKWAGSESFLQVLRERLRRLRIQKTESRGMVDAALSDPGWYSMACLDAATRLVESTADSGDVKRGDGAARVLRTLFDAARGCENGCSIIPDSFWTVLPAGREILSVRGAVLVSVTGRWRGVSRPEGMEIPGEGMTPEVAEALREPEQKAMAQLLCYLKQDGLLAPSALGMAVIIASAGILIEGLLLRSFLELNRSAGGSLERTSAVAALLAFLLLMTVLDISTTATALRMGRRLESRLRIAFLSKIPRLHDRYIQSRLVSDMADRGHGTAMLRVLPMLGSQMTRAVFTLFILTAGVIWLDPQSLLPVLLIALLSVVLPVFVQPLITERDMRLRTHAAALIRFYLDGLLGLIAIRCHGAERAVRREHEGLLTRWMDAGYGFQRTAISLEAVLSIAATALLAWFLAGVLSRAAEAGTTLLGVYWALAIPSVGQEVVLLLRQYSAFYNVARRALEPLGALEDMPSTEHEALLEGEGGVSVCFENLSVKAAGHRILKAIDARIAAGEHVAVVGLSGAGKTSLVGTLLGWHRPSEGRILVDGLPLSRDRLEALRRASAWVDPAVQLWNRTLLENVEYGAPEGETFDWQAVLDAARLRPLLQNLPEGLQTALGEGGALVSGGEGQRVRYARALLRPGVRLVVLDEPFRGLDRGQRRLLLEEGQALWQEATLICITHDMEETLRFKRVLVMEEGRIVEDGVPAVLAGKAGSSYRALLEKERALYGELREGAPWRRLRMRAGHIEEAGES